MKYNCFALLLLEITSVIFSAANGATGANDFSQTICVQGYNGRSPRPCRIDGIAHEGHVTSYIVQVESE